MREVVALADEDGLGVMIALGCSERELGAVKRESLKRAYTGFADRGALDITP